MKIKFKKFEATHTFVKLFGIAKNKASDAPKSEEPDAAYEYYYKRGHTYYFRNNKGEKISIDYTGAQKELIRGNMYNMEAINNPKH